MKGLISHSPGATIIGSTTDWQNLVETGGLGDSYGIEVLFRKNFDLSATWVYGKGNAFTTPVGKYEATRDDPQFIDDEPETYPYPVYLYELKNASRMRSYHRLDIGLNIRILTRWGEGTWNFSVYNLYNRKNPYY